jgi:hypothetical protein
VRRSQPGGPGQAEHEFHPGPGPGELLDKQRLAGELAASWFLRPFAVQACLVAQARSVGGDQAAPDAVLADVPAPQG